MSHTATTTTLENSAPLYQRAPRRDEDGRPLSDFMMIIPQLRTLPPRLIQKKIERIQRVLADFSNLVVFADLNLKINVLWVIVRQSPGACIEIPSAISSVIPEALLVAHPRFC
ncbi:MAG: hypothetical protein HY941_10390 [Gammaproteobacteria bacterium]|nr:hypothetical protein [Gammaproteobacteria bacterium]